MLQGSWLETEPFEQQADVSTKVTSVLCPVEGERGAWARCCPGAWLSPGRKGGRLCWVHRWEEEED